MANARPWRFIVCCDASFVSGPNPFGMYSYLLSGWEIGLRSLVNGVGPTPYSTASTSSTLFHNCIGTYAAGGGVNAGTSAETGLPIGCEMRGPEEFDSFVQAFPDFPGAMQDFCNHAHTFKQEVGIYLASAPLALPALPGGPPFPSDESRIMGYALSLLSLGVDRIFFDVLGDVKQVTGGQKNNLSLAATIIALKGRGSAGAEAYGLTLAETRPTWNGMLSGYADYNRYLVTIASAGWDGPSGPTIASPWYVQANAGVAKATRLLLWANALPNALTIVEINDFP